MIITILIVIFSIVACVESSAYGLYEIRINKNKVRWNCVNSSFSCWTYSDYCCSFEYVIPNQIPCHFLSEITGYLVMFA